MEALILSASRRGGCYRIIAVILSGNCPLLRGSLSLKMNPCRDTKMLLDTSICGNSEGPFQLQSSQWDQLRPPSQRYHSSTPPMLPSPPYKCSQVRSPVNLLHANLCLRFWRCLQETWLATTNYSSPFPLNKYSNFSFSQRQILLTTRHLILCIYWRVNFGTNFSSMRRILKLS